MMKEAVKWSVFNSAMGLAAAAVLVGACKKEDAPSGAGSAQPAVAQAQKQAPQPSLSDEARASIDQALAAYEQMRAKLARDDITGVTDDAAMVQRAATAAANNASASLRTHLTEIASAAGRLKDMAKDNADAVRRAFGDISRPTVALLAAEPSLQRGLHVFECPMAQGYKKWVQTSAAISNPYMGTRMPECGSESPWQEGG